MHVSYVYSRSNDPNISLPKCSKNFLTKYKVLFDALKIYDRKAVTFQEQIHVKYSLLFSLQPFKKNDKLKKNYTIWNKKFQLCGTPTSCSGCECPKHRQTYRLAGWMCKKCRHIYWSLILKRLNKCIFHCFGYFFCINIKTNVDVIFLFFKAKCVIVDDMIVACRIIRNKYDRNYERQLNFQEYKLIYIEINTHTKKKLCLFDKWLVAF